MKRSVELKTAADNSKFPDVKLFIQEELLRSGFTRKDSIPILVAAEEIFVNIAQYSDAPTEGDVVIQMSTSSDPLSVRIRFIDRGSPFDPLAREDPDVNLSYAERQIGGLGIFMARQIMDTISYEFEDGCNILTMEKQLS